MTIYLSHFIDNYTPCFGGRKSIEISPSSSIVNGDSSNSLSIKIGNHVGTHIDFPRHFSNDGKTVNDYPAEFWKFSSISFIQASVERNLIIDQNLIDVLKIDPQTELLLIKTGFQKFRGSEVYWKYNPGVAPKFAGVLKARCPSLAIIGFDFISLSPFQDRKLGREAHKAFLVDNDILIIEDMNLENLTFNPSEVIISPLQISGADGVPVTVLAR